MSEHIAHGSAVCPLCGVFFWNLRLHVRFTQDHAHQQLWLKGENCHVRPA